MNHAIDAEELKKEDEKLKKREYIRNMMRIYRKQDKDGLLYLRNRVKELERQLEQLTVKSKPRDESALPWKDVAHALNDERIQSECQRERLLKEVAKANTLLYDMKRWVAATLTIQRSPDPRGHTWRNSSLFIQPKSRLLGKKWITEQMYHNADRAFFAYDFPPLDVPLNSYEIQFQNGAYDIIMRQQCILDLPPKLVLALFRDYYCDITTVNWFDPVQSNTKAEVTDQTTLHQLEVAHKNHEYVNILVGEFQDQNLIVAQQIIDDEAVSMNVPQRNRKFWMQLVPLPSGQIVQRMLYVKSQLFTRSGGYVPLEDEARLWSIDLSHCKTDTEMEREFRHQGLQVIHLGLKIQAENRFRYHVQQALSKQFADPHSADSTGTTDQTLLS
ncbi:unnamed protein product [Aphanomyces euteiches]|uniref:Uncharacterized protein n=1 Tax=Aphanomyces euteiches TaxID=100861 RepID=A0A6G0XG06_9STRA|nr:hypothetical protein Ae201684_005137 [Aphanomyces euteiches]